MPVPRQTPSDKTVWLFRGRKALGLPRARRIRGRPPIHATKGQNPGVHPHTPGSNPARRGTSEVKAGGSLHAVEIVPAGLVLELLVVDCHGGRRKSGTHSNKVAFFEVDVRRWGEGSSRRESVGWRMAPCRQPDRPAGGGDRSVKSFRAASPDNRHRIPEAESQRPAWISPSFLRAARSCLIEPTNQVRHRRLIHRRSFVARFVQYASPAVS